MLGSLKCRGFLD